MHTPPARTAPKTSHLSAALALGLALAAAHPGPAVAAGDIPASATEYTAQVLRTWRHFTDIQNTVDYCAQHAPTAVELLNHNLDSWKQIYADPQARVDRHMVAWAMREAQRSGRNGRDIAIALDERAKQDNRAVLDPVRQRNPAALARQCEQLALDLASPAYDPNLTHAVELAAMARCRFWKWCADSPDLKP